MKCRFFKYVVFFFLLLTGFNSYSAEKIDLVFNKDILNHAKNQSLNSSNYHAVFGLSQKESLKEIRSVTDKNGVVHTRYSQTIWGVPVWGEQIIISRDQSGNVTALHGRLVKGLGKELANLTPAFSSDTALNLMKEKVKKAASGVGDLFFKNENSDLVVYLDGEDPKLAYSVNFFADTKTGGSPTRPYFIVDAITQDILFQYEGLTHQSLPIEESNISASTREWHFYDLSLSDQDKTVRITTSGSNGDADMYVFPGTTMPSNTNESYCTSLGPYSNESCVIGNMREKSWKIGIYAYRRYNGLTLSAYSFDAVSGTGPGGNEKTSKYDYGLGLDFDPFKVLSVDSGSKCLMHNETVKTINLDQSASNAFDYSDNGNCLNEVKQINGAYSPLNDAHNFGGIVFDMYKKWLNVSPLTFQLTMKVHYGTNYENAFWDGSSMTFGDGYTTFFPLVSLDVSAHEVSHGFTEQNSGLVYSGQSGGINEAFSDMAGEAAEFYMKGSNDFLVGAEIFKADNQALRYMCEPTDDDKSIGSALDYYGGLDVHYSSGVFNKAFCLLATTSGWDTQKAFITFAKANMTYWTPNATFVSAAGGVYDAAKDLEFAAQDVVDAFCGVDVIIPDYDCTGGSVTNQPPNVTVDFPDGSTSVSGTVDLIANASDLDGNVTSVEFFVGESSVGLDNVVSDGWSVSWDSTQVSDGSHIITAKATDNDSAVTTSAGVSVTVNNGTTTSSPVTTELLDQSASGSRGRWNAIALVTVTGDASVNGLTVSGSWSNGANGSGNCTTDASGTCQIAKQNLKSNVASVTFTIDSVTDSNGSVVITGGSDTSINLMQP